MVFAFGVFVAFLTFGPISWVKCDALKPNDLQFALIFSRHGDRTPLVSYPNDPHKYHKWRGGFGHLTEKGALRMYTLGENVRNRYVDLLPSDGFYSADRLRVVSSPRERCLMSAQSMMAGLLPPSEQYNTLPIPWQPVPVNSLPDKSMLVFPHWECPKYMAIHKSLLRNPEPNTAIYEFYQMHAHLFANLSAYTGEHINLLTAAFLHGTLEVQRDHNLELPTWTETIGLDQLAILRNRLLAMSTETPYMTRVTAGPLIAEFVDKMTGWDSGVLTQKLLIYSAHDYNIIDVMNALNMSNQIDNYPDFGAALALELYRADGPTTELKIFYYAHPEVKVPQELSIPNCSTPCSLNQFTELVKHIAVRADEFHEMCRV